MTKYVSGLAEGVAPGQLPVGKARFTGRFGTFLGLLASGALLQLLTFGFYRFWLKTRIRQHLWSNTRIGEDALEYTGTARELLIGFLTALAVLTPIYVVYFLLGLEAERLRTFSSFPLALAMTVLGYYAAFRARRYRMTRTTFRGLRFWMTGSGWNYAIRAMAWNGLVIVTLGLALPWRTASLERYKWACTRFGDLSGMFVGTGWSLFKRGMLLWLLMLLVAVTAIAVPPLMLPRESIFSGLVASLGLTGLFFLVVVLPIYDAIRLKWVLHGIRFGDISVLSNISKFAVLRCHWAAIMVGAAYLAVVSLLVGFILLAAVNAGLIGHPGAPGASKDLGTNLAILAPFYLVILIGIGAIKTLFVERGLWKIAANSLVVTNIAALDAVVAHGNATASLDEGLADALDVGAI